MASRKPNQTLSFKEAMDILSESHRDTLASHAFGDAEVGWMKDGAHVAEGYFSSRKSSIHFSSGRWYLATTIEGAAADRLRECYKTQLTTRNDEADDASFETGDDDGNYDPGSETYEDTDY